MLACGMLHVPPHPFFFFLFSMFLLLHSSQLIHRVVFNYHSLPLTCELSCQQAKQFLSLTKRSSLLHQNLMLLHFNSSQVSRHILGPVCSLVPQPLKYWTTPNEWGKGPDFRLIGDKDLTAGFVESLIKRDAKMLWLNATNVWCPIQAF